MRKIILDLAVTLDGFIEGPNGEIDWCIIEEDGDFKNSDFGQFLDTVDTIIYGRISYDLWGEYQPEEGAGPAVKDVFKAVHSKMKVVFSKTISKPPSENVTYVNEDLIIWVSKLRQEPGKNLWLYGGAKLITTFINAGLVNTYRLSVHPVLLGSGKPLFDNIQQRHSLSLVSSTPGGAGVVVLVYDALDTNK